jgi:hypothetical protein
MANANEECVAFINGNLRVAAADSSHGRIICGCCRPFCLTWQDLAKILDPDDTPTRRWKFMKDGNHFHRDFADWFAHPHRYEESKPRVARIQ